MKSNLIDEQGHFWWRDEVIPENQFAPEENVSGQLKVAEDGTTKLELDGMLPAQNSQFERLFTDKEELRRPRAIQGILKSTGRHVLLLDAVPNGGSLNTSRFSYEKFLATRCLVGDAEFPRAKGNLRLSNIQIDLRGFEQWLGLGSIQAKTTARSTSITNRAVKIAPFDTPRGKLAFTHSLEVLSNDGPGTYEMTIREVMTLSLKPRKAFLPEQVHAELNTLQDLMIVLTGSHYSLAWPIVQIARTKVPYTLYLRRGTSSATPPRWHASPINFRLIKEQFGFIYSSWHEKLAEFGSGFFSYASTKRDVKMYVESQFLTLVTGLESFHRTKYGDQAPSSALQEKIERIVGQVNRKQDRAWLARKLKHGAEPALSERLFALFSSLPLGLGEKELKDFAELCADVRNDLSHLGGRRTRQSGANYLQDLSIKSEAVSVLYHALILREIGLSDTLLKGMFFDRHRAYSTKLLFVQVGLMSKDALRPPATSLSAESPVAQ